jgi:hypothetical protein
MSAKHTPGPWEVNAFGGDFEVIARLVPSGVAVSANQPCADRDAIATARLIASAPALLNALQAQEAAELHHMNCSECMHTTRDWACCESCSAVYGPAINLRWSALSLATGEGVRK